MLFQGSGQRRRVRVIPRRNGLSHSALFQATGRYRRVPWEWAFVTDRAGQVGAFHEGDRSRVHMAVGLVARTAHVRVQLVSSVCGQAESTAEEIFPMFHGTESTDVNAVTE